MKAYQEEHLPLKEVARRYRVTAQLVRDLVYEAKHRPEKQWEAKQRMKEKEKKRAAITMAVDCLQRKGSVIESSQKVCSLVKETDELEVSQKLVRQVLKEFRLSFIKAKKLHPQANSARNLVLR